MEAQSTVRKQRGISPLWTLPVLAIVICGWLLYKSFMEAGIEIVVYFDDASGITPEKTQVMSMGLPLGVVKKMQPDIEKNKVKVTIRMDRSTEPYLVEDAKFWIVKPEVSASRITGLDTILSGSYISVQRGTSKKSTHTFTGLSSSPPIPDDTPGLHIKLRSSALRSIQEGSSIYFRNIKIGTIESYRLEPEETILLNAYILPEYQNLIKKGSRFYDASGVTFAGKLTNLKIRMESLASLFVGGIVVNTPDALKNTPAAVNGDIFTLYDDFEAADYGIPMKLKLASGAGITEGVTKVMYRGLEAGYVRQIDFNQDPERTATAHILLDPRAEIILREHTTFWMVSPSISTDGVKNIGTLLTGSYITFKPGGGGFRDSFELLHEAPAQAPLRPGKTLLLTSSDTVFQTGGAPVYYHSMQVGEIIGSELSDDRESVVTRIYIYEEYTDLVSNDSVFIKTGGVSVNVGFTGFEVKIKPLQSLLKGGIDLLNPGKQPSLMQKTDENTTYILYRDYESAMRDHPRLKPKGLYFTLIAESLGSYDSGSPILYKKIKVGQVIGYRIEEKTGKIRMNCFIEQQYRHLVSDKSRFFNVSGVTVFGSFQGVSIKTESLQSLITGGVGFISLPGGRPVADNSAFIVYDSLPDAEALDKTEIVVRFKNADQLNVGAHVKHRGIQIGTVQTVQFDTDLKTIIARLSVENRFETFFREGTRIWITSPEVNLKGIKNLETVLFGSSLELYPGKGDIVHEFIGFEKKPQIIAPENGDLHIVLETKHLGSIDIGSQVYYRQMPVGRVTGYNLAADFKDVFVYVSIHEQYAAIVRENTRFWNASGIKVTGGIFSGVTVSTQSFQSLMTGGIALATPGKEKMGSPVFNGYHFKLHDDPENGWLDWTPDIFTVDEEKNANLSQ